jgi:hypothetical protein
MQSIGYIDRVYERRINKIVDQLYGLSEEEIKIAEQTS